MAGYIIFCLVFLGIAWAQDTQPAQKEDFLTKMLDYRDVMNYLDRMQRKYPHLIELETIGYTAENREIVMAKIGTKTGRQESAKPSMWFDSAMHAREAISVSVTQYMIDTLVKTYETDNDTKDYVDKLTWYIVPILNPDGYEYSRERNFVGSRDHFLWRKNRRRADCTVEYCFLNNRGDGCYGVDLNRNFGYRWGSVQAGPDSHTSNDSCSDLYSGPRAFSERESQAVRDFVLGHRTLKAYFTIHSYAQMWFYPYGYARGALPSDISELRDLALRATAAMRSLYGTTYDVGSAADLYYPVSGSAVDWAKGAAGVKYSYAIELRPRPDNQMSAFLVQWSDIEPICKEAWAGLRVVADEVIKRYG